MTSPTTSEERRIAAQKLHEAAQVLRAYHAEDSLVQGVLKAAEEVFNGQEAQA